VLRAYGLGGGSFEPPPLFLMRAYNVRFTPNSGHQSAWGIMSASCHMQK
jgi:hypothetical protein